jgi:hypothetical protein
MVLSSFRLKLIFNADIGRAFGFWLLTFGFWHLAAGLNDCRLTKVFACRVAAYCCHPERSA